MSGNGNDKNTTSVRVAVRIKPVDDYIPPALSVPHSQIPTAPNSIQSFITDESECSLYVHSSSLLSATSAAAEGVWDFDTVFGEDVDQVTKFPIILL